MVSRVPELGGFGWVRALQDPQLQSTGLSSPLAWAEEGMRGELQTAGVASDLCRWSCSAENSPLSGRLARGV